MNHVKQRFLVGESPTLKIGSKHDTVLKSSSYH